jgi:hypothetical protein
VVLHPRQHRAALEINSSVPQVNGLLHAKPTLRRAADSAGNPDCHFSSHGFLLVQQFRNICRLTMSRFANSV